MPRILLGGSDSRTFYREVLNLCRKCWCRFGHTEGSIALVIGPRQHPLTGHLSSFRCFLTYQSCQSLIYRRCLLHDSIARHPVPEGACWPSLGVGVESGLTPLSVLLLLQSRMIVLSAVTVKPEPVNACCLLCILYVS